VRASGEPNVLEPKKATEYTVLFLKIVTLTVCPELSKAGF
jgi:hypothetical protein